MTNWRIVGVMAMVNLVGVVGFAIGFGRTFFTDVEVRGRFVQLDREGVISANALEAFDRSYGFSTADMGYRDSVPRYIAGPALAAERRNALLGGGCALCNAIVLGGLYVRGRRCAAGVERSVAEM